jgi:hypothetical protein
MTVADHHYLRAPVDARCSPLAYEVVLDMAHSKYRASVLIFVRPEVSRCSSSPANATVAAGIAPSVPCWSSRRCCGEYPYRRTASIH